MRIKWIALAALLCTTSSIAQVIDEEHPKLRSSSAEFKQSLASSVDELTRSGFADHLQTPGMRAVSSAHFEELRSAIKAEHPIAGVTEGQPGAVYDVILQPGHYGRTTGAVGTSGHLVSERALAAYVVNRIAQRLRAAGLSVLVISADHYLHGNPQSPSFNGLRGKVFLAVHADGSAQPCTTGPSLAYSGTGSLLSMHALGFALATALGYDYADFNRDNFTVNEAHYYMFRQVRASRLTGLLEVGELTCDRSERNLIGSADLMGTDLAQALQFISQLPGG